jgi:hypothetical protein
VIGKKAYKGIKMNMFIRARRHENQIKGDTSKEVKTKTSKITAYTILQKSFVINIFIFLIQYIIT